VAPDLSSLYSQVEEVHIHNSDLSKHILGYGTTDKNEHTITPSRPRFDRIFEGDTITITATTKSDHQVVDFKKNGEELVCFVLNNMNEVQWRLAATIYERTTVSIIPLTE
jgi:hypothetical protein